MGKFILSLPMLGDQFMPTLNKHADFLATEKGIDKAKLTEDINKAVGPADFKKIIESYFNDDLKIILTK